jgi:hypothetical protein
VRVQEVQPLWRQGAPILSPLRALCSRTPVMLLSLGIRGSGKQQPLCAHLRGLPEHLPDQLLRAAAPGLL